MAKFDFYTRNAAHNNCAVAVLRESTRMCIMAKAMQILGHDVRIVDAPNCLTGIARWQFFSDLCGQPTGGVQVRPAETMSGSAKADVGFKTSIGSNDDIRLQGFCSKLFSYADKNSSVSLEKYIQVPFLVCDRVISQFFSDELIGDYIENNLQEIRSFYLGSSPEVQSIVGGVMHGSRYRKEFCKDLPHWFDVKFYDSHLLTAKEHMEYLSWCHSAIALKGDVTRTYLPPLLSLLGIPMVVDTSDAMVNPVLEHKRNCFILSPGDPSNISDLESLLKSGESENWAVEAQRFYLEHWSPLGQARKIAEAFE